MSSEPLDRAIGLALREIQSLLGTVRSGPLREELELALHEVEMVCNVSAIEEVARPALGLVWRRLHAIRRALDPSSFSSDDHK